MSKPKTDAATTTIPKKDQPDKYTQQEMIDALIFAKGMRTKAAKKLGCNYRTVVRYIEEYPAVAEAENDSRESMLDAIELKAYAAAMKGDNTMMIFMLKTQGKKRGYIEKQQIDLNIDSEKLALLTKLIEQRGKKLSDVVEEMLQELQRADVANAVS